MKIQTELQGDTFTVTLDSPDNRNAQTPQTWDMLTNIYSSVPQEARFIVIRGSGKAFSAGLDRAMFSPEGIPGQPSFMEMASLGEAELDAQIARYQAPFRQLRNLPQISIALVQGYAIGAGFQLALSCDMIIATPDAQMALKETSWGLIPDLGGSGHIHRLLGYSRAMEFCLTGRFMSGQEALDLGVVVAVNEDLEAELNRILEPVRAALPSAVTETKSILRNIDYGEEPWLAERQSQTRRLQDLRNLYLSSMNK